MTIEHFHHGIEGWTQFEDIYREAVAGASDGARFVEVGCWKGRSAAFMAVEIINSGKRIDFTCIDEWADGGKQFRHYGEVDLMGQFIANTAPVAHVITPVKARSVDAAARFADGSLGFVFIDAAHDYESVIADLEAWAPKVRSGGTLAGDDYSLPGVKRACDEFFGGVYVGAGEARRRNMHACWRVSPW